MKKIKLIFLIILLINTSCVEYFVHKAYIPNPPDVCHLEEKGDFNFKTEANTSSGKVRFQGNYAFSDNWGVTTNLYGAVACSFRIDAGLVRYFNLPNLYFEISSGLGYNNFRMNYSGEFENPMLIYTQYESYEYDIEGKNIKMYIQPAYYNKIGENKFIGLSLNVNNLYYLKYSYRYNAEEYYDEDISYDDNLNLQSFYTLFLEPAINYKIQSGSKNTSVIFQLGYSYLTRYYISKVYPFPYGDYRIYHHPRHIPVIFNFGFQFRFFDKKQSKNKDLKN